MRKKVFLVFALIFTVLNLVYSLFLDGLSIGFPLPFFVRILDNAPCSGTICPDVMLPKTSFYPKNLAVNIFVWILFFLIIDKQFVK